MGKDTHAVSGPAQRTALEVLVANNVETIIQKRRRLHTNASHFAKPSLFITEIVRRNFADGIVITPSHNPPADGGFEVQSHRMAGQLTLT